MHSLIPHLDVFLFVWVLIGTTGVALFIYLEVILDECKPFVWGHIVLIVLGAVIGPAGLFVGLCSLVASAFRDRIPFMKWWNKPVGKGKHD